MKPFVLVQSGSNLYITSMKMSYQIILYRPAAALLSLLLLLGGCSPTNTSLHSPDIIQVEKNEQNADAAVQHFIHGSVLEAKDDYANAIIEYQDALRYDDNASIRYAIAKDYMAMDKPSLAGQYAKQAVDMAPDNVHYLELLAEVYTATALNDSAIIQYEKISSLDPQNIQAQFTLAQLYTSSKPLKALEVYNRLRDRVGDEWEILYKMSEVYDRLGKKDSAAITMELLLNFDPGNTTLRTAVANLYLQAKQIDKARAMYKDLVERDPKNIRFALMLADVERSDGHWAEAIATYSRVLSDDSLNVEDKMQIGETLFQISLADSTHRSFLYPVFAQLYEKYPQDWRSNWFLGAYYFNNRQYDEAIPYLKKVTELDSKNIQAYDILARTYLSQNDYEHAKEVLEDAVVIDSNNADLFSFLGFAYSRLGVNEKTVSTLERALKLNPKQMDALSTLALALDAMKNFRYSDSLYESALAAYEGGLQKDASYYLLLNNYAYSLSERGLQLQRALEMSKQAIEYEKENSSYLDTYGWIFFKLEDYPNALTYIMKAIDIRDTKDHQSGSALYEHLGDIYFKMGEKEKAMSNWSKALEQDKSNTALKEKIAKGSL